MGQPTRRPFPSGADVLESTIPNYEITHVIDPHNRRSLSMQQPLEMIRGAGQVPVARDGLYSNISRWEVEALLEALPTLRDALLVLN